MHKYIEYSNDFISLPEPKAQVSFFGHNLTVVRGRRRCCRYNINLFNILFFSRTTGPISTKLDTKHPWVQGIHVCKNEGPHPFSGDDNNKIAKNPSPPESLG